MKLNFNVMMTIWCAFFALYALICMFTSPLWAALIQVFFLILQLSLGTYYAIQAREPFCKFYENVKEILKN